MNATLYTGNSPSSQTITNGVSGQSFQPDFVWIKNRSSTTFHSLWDSNRGVSAGGLASNDTMAEQSSTAGNDFVSFNSNGFSVGPQQNWNVNGSSTNLVGWQWKAGGTAVTNTQGTISSQVSANTTSGFSVVTYTGTGATGTIGHGCLVNGVATAPNMSITKNRTPSTTNWGVYHSSIGATKALFLNLTNSTSTSSVYWNDAAPTNTLFTVGTANENNGSAGWTYVAYCFAAVSGYSAFGSYTGNGSTDGPFVYLGFRPRFVMIKRSDAGAVNWYIFDTARDTYNAAGLELYPNLPNAEADGRPDLDILSNGFKIRSTSGGQNTSSGTYIYACWAENPFKYANAR
jgi:hypothetical protein